MSFKPNRKQTVCDCGETYLEHVLPKKFNKQDVLQSDKDFNEHASDSLVHQKYYLQLQKKFGPTGPNLTTKSTQVVTDKQYNSIKRVNKK